MTSILNGLSMAHGVAYVVASDPTTAVKFVQQSLKRKNLGSDFDRALDKVELIAEDKTYPDCGYTLYISKKKSEEEPSEE
jgi:hypothetical protein